MKKHHCISYEEWHLNVCLLQSVKLNLWLAVKHKQSNRQACCQPLTQPFCGVTKAWEEGFCSGPPGMSLYFISGQRADVNQLMFYCQVVICEESGRLRSACHLSLLPAAGLYTTNWLTCSHSRYINMATFNKWQAKKERKGEMWYTKNLFQLSSVEMLSWIWRQHFQLKVPLLQVLPTYSDISVRLFLSL